MKMLRLKTITTAAALAAPMLFAVPTNAAPGPVVDDEEEAAEEEEEEDEDEYLAVVGGDIYTGTGAILRGATLLAKNGVYILENMWTNDLAADGVHEFLFVLGQPKFKGAVQMVINPIAIH